MRVCTHCHTCIQTHAAHMPHLHPRDNHAWGGQPLPHQLQCCHRYPVPRRGQDKPQNFHCPHQPCSYSKQHQGAELGLGRETMKGPAHSVPDARKDGRVAKSKSKNKTQIRQWRRRRARGSGSQPERGPNEQQKGSSEQEVPAQEGGGMGHVKG